MSWWYPTIGRDMQVLLIKISLHIANSEQVAIETHDGSHVCIDGPGASHGPDFG